MSEYHAPSVVEGKLVTFSPTSLEKHERCNRRWWFSKVANREDPAGPAASDGTIRHDRIEKYLLGGPILPLQAPEKELLRFLPAPNKPGVRYEVPVESITQLKVEGVSVIGRIDLINDSGSWLDNEGVEHKMEPNEIEVHDHKFTGNLEYAKTPNQMANTIQMRLYAKAALGIRKVIDRVRVSHGYAQTKRKAEALKVSKILTVHEIETFWFANIVPAVRLMKHTARQTEFAKVRPNFEACLDFGKACPFISECQRDSIAMIVGFGAEISKGFGTQPALPSTNNAGFGGNTMSLLSKFNGSEQIAAPTATDIVNEAFSKAQMSVLPPDAPPSDPVLAVAGAEGQFHKNAIGLYVVKDGQWTLAGAKSKADYEALVEGSKTAGGSPALAEAPKRGRGRPKKIEPVVPPQIIQPIEPVVLDGAPVKHPEPAAPAPEPMPAGIMFWYNSIPSVPTQDLAGYVYGACAKLASNSGCSDIRASEHEALRYGKWKGILSAYVQQNPPPPNAYRLIGNDEIYEIVANALIPLCYLSTRGVK